MINLNFLFVLFFLFPANFIAPPPARQPVAAVGDLWLDVSLGAPIVDWFNEVARPTDIARIESPTEMALLDQISTGRKLVVFKSVDQAEDVLPEIADRIDIMGYNLEHSAIYPADEQAAPLESVRRMRALADEYGLMLAFGPDHDFALSHGVAVAPYVDIFVLQVQRAQTDPQDVYDFVRPLIPQLRKANPDLQVTVQVRTEGDVVAVADLIAALRSDLDGVSILTSFDTIPVAEALVEELRSRTAVPPSTYTPSPCRGYH